MDIVELFTDFNKKMDALLNYPRTPEILAFWIIGVFLLQSNPNEELSKIVIFPNIVLWVFTFLSSFFLGISKNSTGDNSAQYIVLLVLSVIPPILASKLIWDWIREQKKVGNPKELYLGGYLIIFVLLLFTIFTLLIIILSFFFTNTPFLIIYRILYLLALGPLGVIGWVLGRYSHFTFKSETNKVAILTVFILWMILSLVPIQWNPIVS